MCTRFLVKAFSILWFSISGLLLPTLLDDDLYHNNLNIRVTCVDVCNKLSLEWI